MSAVQLEPGLRVMIEKRRFPILRGMTAEAIGRAVSPAFRCRD